MLPTGANDISVILGLDIHDIRNFARHFRRDGKDGFLCSCDRLFGTTKRDICHTVIALGRLIDVNLCTRFVLDRIDRIPTFAENACNGTSRNGEFSSVAIILFVLDSLSQWY